ncbi:hypothetical protein CFIICLFH_4144 [Methylobacterium goesingense]|nr:hypothetical protein CFIICLFH_4144 [Methylobacterium goesingense]
MGGRAAVGVDDDLAAGEAGIAVGTADDELARGVHVPDGFLGNPVLRQGGEDVGLDDGAHVGGIEALVDVLGGEHDLGDAHRAAVLVAHRDLALGIGAELGGVALLALARVGEVLEDLVGVVDRRRHQLGRLVGRVAEHDALVARALVLVAGRVDALGDVGGLGVQVDRDVVVLPVEARLLVADVLHHRAGELFQMVEGHGVGAAHLARDDDAVRGGQRLHAEAGFRHRREIGIHDSVGDPVADLVGMSFRDRFAREEIIGTRHEGPQV